LVPATKKESIFTKEGVFGCDVFNLRFWKLRRSTLLREVVVCGSGDTAFSQKKFDLLAVGKKQVNSGRIQERSFHSGWEKTGRFFLLSSRVDRRFSMAKGNILYKVFFFQMRRSCSPSSLIRHSQSS